MAVVTRFVNTASSAGGDGTTNNTSGADRAYVSLSEWNTNEAADLTAGGDTHIVNCVGTAADTVGNVQITGWTTDVGDFITINGENTTGKYSASDYRIEYTTTGNYQEGATFAEGFTGIFDMQIQVTSNDVSCRGYNITATEIDISRSMAKGVISAPGGGANAAGFFVGHAISGDLRSCLALDWTESNTKGFWGVSTTTPSRFDNCTAHNCDIGFITSYLDTDLRNCLAQNCVNGFSGTFASADSCASDIASDAPGTNTQTGNVTFVDEAGDDFQPANSDTIAKENGADLSGEFDFDLAGNSFGATWTIGCLTFAAADAPTLKTGSDALTTGLVDTLGNLTVILSIAESIAVVLTETASAVVAKGASDAVSIGITDQFAQLRALITRDDDARIAVSDVMNNLLVTLSRPDTVEAIAADEINQLLVILSTALDLRVQIDEAQNIAVVIASTDSVAIGLDEATQPMSVLLPVSDALSIGIVDAFNLVNVVISRGDAFTVALDDGALVKAFISTADTLRVQATEVQALALASITAADSLKIGASDAMNNLQALVIRADALSISTVDVLNLIFVRLVREQNIAIGVTEGATVAVIAADLAVRHTFQAREKTFTFAARTRDYAFTSADFNEGD